MRVGAMQTLSPGDDVARRWEALGGEEDLVLGTEVFASHHVPALLAQGQAGELLLLFGLSERGLALFGYDKEPELCAADVGLRVLEQAEAVGRRIGSACLVTAVTNADIVPFAFLQEHGFRLVEVEPLAHRTKGVGGIERSHQFLLERPIPSM